MTREPADALPFDEQSAFSLTEVLQLSGLAEQVLRELVTYGALDPIDPSAVTLRFSSRCVVVARTASRLQRDFELDAHALAVVLSFAERIEALEGELRALHARALRG